MTAPAMLKIRIDNAYSDGHTSEHFVYVPAPAGPITDEWWEDVVYPHTGDGHGIDSDLGCCYTATVWAEVGADLAMLGASKEWS